MISIIKSSKEIKKLVASNLPDTTKDIKIQAYKDIIKMSEEDLKDF